VGGLRGGVCECLCCRGRGRQPPHACLHVWLSLHPAPAAGREYVPPTAKAAADDDTGEAEAEAIEVGSRCSVDPGERRGEVK
jgi:hypothetical protein